MDDRINLYLFVGFWLLLIIGSVTGVLVFYTDFGPSETSEEVDYSVSVPEEALVGEEIEAQLNSEEAEVQEIEARLDGEIIGETDEEGRIEFISEEEGIKTLIFETEREITRNIKFESEEPEEINLDLEVDKDDVEVSESFTTEASTEREIQSFSWTINETELEESGSSITESFEEAGVYEITVAAEKEELQDEASIEINVFETEEELDEEGAEEQEQESDEDESDEEDSQDQDEDTGEESEDEEDEFQEPVISLDMPEDGETIETFEDKEDIEFEFTVEDRGDASEITLEIEETGHEYTRPVTSGQIYMHEFEDIPASEEGETYTWSVSTESNEFEESTSFELEIVEPGAILNINDETELGDGEVEFNYFAESDVEAELEIEIIADEELSRTWDQCDESGNLEEETVSYDDGEAVRSFDMGIFGGQKFEDADFTEILIIEGEYSWRGEITAVEENRVLDSAGSQTFVTTDQPEEDSEEDCSEGGG